MAPPEQTQGGDDESGDAADVASTQTTQGTLPDVGRLVPMCPFCHVPDMQAAANECFQCGSPIQLPDTALADAPVERLNVSRFLGAVDKALDMLEADTDHLKYCIAQYAKDEARIQVVHDNARRIMHATDRDLSRLGTEVMERVLRLERLRRRFEDEIESPRKRRRLIADTPPGENVAHAQASALLSSGLTTGVVAKKKIIRKKQPENAAQKALRLANGRLSHSVRSLKKKSPH